MKKNLLAIMLIICFYALKSQNSRFHADFEFIRKDNTWIFHVPNDERKAMFIAPRKNGFWDWGSQFVFYSNGSFLASGGIHSRDFITYDTNITPPDYVFQKYYTGSSTLKSDYKMPTLQEVEEFTKKHHHLPSMPSAKEIQEKGLELGLMSNLLLQKIEELTLYVIEQQKQMNDQKEQNIILKKKLKILEETLSQNK